jgi:peptide deformylase
MDIDCAAVLSTRQILPGKKKLRYIMAILDILTYPDNFLNKTARPVEKIDEAVRTLVADMADTMYQAPGVGLAATQVGSDLRIIVYDPDADKDNRPFQVLVNPRIVSTEGSVISEDEGCLSVPEFRADVERAEKTVIEGQDMDGNPVTIESDGLLSVIFQHEIDHLDGILFIDRISRLKREIYKRKVKKQLKRSA